MPDPLDIGEINVAGNKPRRRRSGLPWLITGCLIVVLVAGGYYGWLYLQQWQAEKHNGQLVQQTQLDNQAQQIQALQQQLQQQQHHLQQALTDLEAQANQLHQGGSAYRQQLDELQRRVTSQGSRLRDLSTSTRDDWLLAEAEYLLRLANQRLLTERSTASPVSLLQTADAILKEFDDPDLFVVRRQIASEITALKIATVVDREGLYLRLDALGDVIPKLTLARSILAADANTGGSVDQSSVVQSSVDQGSVGQSSVGQSSVDQSSIDKQQGWGDRVVASLADFANGLKEYVRIRRRDKPIEPLLGVEEEQYLRHNLQVMLAQAQLSLLREEPLLYTASLEKSQQWLQQYFQSDSISRSFAEQLTELAQHQVTSQLPEISSSLQALRSYINLWHLRHESPPQGNNAQRPSDPEAPVEAAK